MEWLSPVTGPARNTCPKCREKLFEMESWADANHRGEPHEQPSGAPGVGQRGPLSFPIPTDFLDYFEWVIMVLRSSNKFRAYNLEVMRDAIPRANDHTFIYAILGLDVNPSPGDGIARIFLVSDRVRRLFRLHWQQIATLPGDMIKNLAHALSKFTSDVRITVENGYMPELWSVEGPSPALIRTPGVQPLLDIGLGYLIWAEKHSL